MNSNFSLKTIMRSLLLIPALLLPQVASAARTLSDIRFESIKDVMLFFDRDRNLSLNSEERDALRAARLIRNDLSFLDVDGNGKLNREELDLFEARFNKEHHRDVEKTKTKKKEDKEKDKEKEKKKDKKKKKS